MKKNNVVIPYVGVNDFKLKSSFIDVIKYLKKNNYRYTKEHWPNKGCTTEVPWDIIRFSNGLSLFFANDKMFKIYIESNSEFELDNGICIGNTMEAALSIDPTLYYDEDAEVYVSEHGYWLEDSLIDDTVLSITIFIGELNDDDIFFAYNW